MKYTEAIEYMESLSAYRSMPGKDSFKELCERMGNPQKDLQFVHIAGIAGKNSIPSYVASVLKCAGYKAGRYISPAVFEYIERFQVGNKPITKKILCELAEQVKEICDGIAADGYPYPAYLEVEAAIAFRYFKDQGCAMVILETHREEHQDAAAIMDLIKAQIRELNVPVTDIDECSAKKIKHGLEKQRFDYKEWKNLEISLAGAGQVQNAVLAIEVLERLQEQGYSIGEAALRKGLRETSCSGDFTVIGRKPYFVADTAQDLDAALDLVRSIELYFKNKRILYIMGMLRDKEYEKIINLTHEYADWIITVTPPKAGGAMSSYELATEIAKVHPNVTAVDSMEEAVEVSCLLTGKEDVIIAFGPLSFSGRVMEIVKNRKA